jgi:hypothetical protein
MFNVYWWWNEGWDFSQTSDLQKKSPRDDQKNIFSTNPSLERGMHEDEFTPKFRDPNDPEFVRPTAKGELSD